MKKDCIFCKITKGESPAEFIYKNDDFIVFRDIKPSAPIHLLIVPIFSDHHIDSINHLKEEDEKMIGKLFLLANCIAREQGLDKSGYKLLFNVGRGGGQIIDHLHLHLLGGFK